MEASVLPVARKWTLSEVGERKEPIVLPQEEKSSPGLWPTSLSLPAMEKLKERGMDGWREEEEEWEQNDWNSRWLMALAPDWLRERGAREGGRFCNHWVQSAVNLNWSHIYLWRGFTHTNKRTLWAEGNWKRQQKGERECWRWAERNRRKEMTAGKKHDNAKVG